MRADCAGAVRAKYQKPRMSKVSRMQRGQEATEMRRCACLSHAKCDVHPHHAHIGRMNLSDAVRHVILSRFDEVVHSNFGLLNDIFIIA